jgi:Na+/H+ antiporter NhaD/arsenite permease-like protein
MLLSIAIMPLTIPHFWHHNYGKVAVFWAAVTLIPMWLFYGFGIMSFEFVHIILADYIPFILLLFALFTVSGGICLKGDLVGTPQVNTAIIALGTVLASWMGTTGAAMLLIRPLLRANAHRKFKVHTVVFFIFLVANIGGSLTPLGDPPLFLGFLRGVTFFWTLGALWLKTLMLSVILLGGYFIADAMLFKKEGSPKGPQSGTKQPLAIAGSINFVLLACVVASVLMSGTVDMGAIKVYGIPLALQNLLRDGLMIVIALISLKVTAKETRAANDFNWEPILEVGKLFFGIFVCMVPVLAILQSGDKGALKAVIEMVSANGKPVDSMYFWITGTLSSFLDNAPTYVVFFETAGAAFDTNVAKNLMTTYYSTLTAISAGAVFFGAVTYIGNAPNFMVRSIAENSGVKMPSFVGYMAWSIGILCPCFALLTFLFF